METRPTADEPAAGEPEGLEDLPVADEAAEHVTGGETAATTPTAYRGKYQLRLGEAGGLLK